MGLVTAYRQRHPERTAFYRCLEDYWQEFRDSYAYLYEKDYGPLRPVVERNVQRFLDCGIFHQGFARVRCGDCGSEYILAFSCKTRYYVAGRVMWLAPDI